ncbi:MAG: hypothetical protein H7Z17_10600 [Fuerstia sp.]|nr:hypothetical protein [Fuerstiella sp.]
MSGFLRRIAPRVRKQKGAHLTFAHSRIGRSMSQTSLFLKKQLWIWPIIAVLLLASVGYGVRSAISYTIQQNLESQLQTLLNVETAMLKTWFQVQESNAESAANRLRVREIFDQLQKASAPALKQNAGSEAPDTDLHAELSHELSPLMSAHNYIGYIIANKDQKILSASSAELIDKVEMPEMEFVFSETLNGRTTVCPPFLSVDAIKDARGKIRTGVPIMLVCAPIRDERFQVTGLLADRDDSRSLLNIEIRNPGVDVIQGARPALRRAEQPLTTMAASAVEGNSGVTVEPYGDYRGVPVVGAWSWLEPYGMGVTTEIDYEEAFRPLTILQWMFTGLYVLLGASSVAIFVFTVVVARFSEAQNWTEIEADGWWSRHERGLPAAQVNASMVAAMSLMTKAESPAKDSGTSAKPAMTTPGFDQTMISNEID